MGNLKFFFVQSVKPDHFAGHLAVLNFYVGSFQKTELVQTRETRQMIDQAYVGSFRRLYGTNPAIMRTVHIAHFKTGTLTG